MHALIFPVGGGGGAYYQYSLPDLVNAFCCRAYGKLSIFLHVWPNEAMNQSELETKACNC